MVQCEAVYVTNTLGGMDICKRPSGHTGAHDWRGPRAEDIPQCNCDAVPFPHWDRNHPPRDTRPTWVKRAMGATTDPLSPKVYHG